MAGECGEGGQDTGDQAAAVIDTEERRRVRSKVEPAESGAQVLGAQAAQFLRRRIFQPLGMTSTRWRASSGTCG